MLWEYYCGNEVYGTMPIYSDGKATNPFKPMLGIMSKYNLKSVAFRIKHVDVR